MASFPNYTILGVELSGWKGLAIGSLNVIIQTHGTSGDVHPMVAVGAALRKRGHRITLMCNQPFEGLARSHGFEFVSLGSEEEFQEIMDDPNLWRPLHGARVLGRVVCDYIGPQYAAIMERHEPGRTVLVASGAAFGARIAQETMGIPLATIMLQPALIRSLHDTSQVAGIPYWVTRLPRIIKRPAFRIGDFFGDRVFHVRRVNAFRGKFGLPPANRLLWKWWYSSQRVIGLFPPWFAPPQPDWQPQLRLTGFPLYDEGDKAALPEPVEAFLANGEPPIAFTPGSGMKHGGFFFEAAVDACLRLKRRGLLLTGYPDQIPAHIPETVHHARYAPFGALLPRMAAIVHHGGIGTLAQGLAAGIPQVLMPMAFDQPDNGVRVRRLGVGAVLSRRQFCGRNLAAALERLLASRDVTQNCHDACMRLQNDRPLDTTCRIIEDLVPQAHTNQIPAAERAIGR